MGGFFGGGSGAVAGPVVARCTIFGDGSADPNSQNIDSVVANAGGEWTVTFTPGTFTVNPTCVVSLRGVNGTAIIASCSGNMDTCNVYLMDASGATGASRDVYFVAIGE